MDADADIDADREWLTEHGDLSATEREVLRTVVGSGVHGIAIEGTDDHDEMGVYVETPRAVLGIGHVEGHYVARTVAEGHRSRHGDVDLVMYSLRRYLALVTTGNPTALLSLFTPLRDVVVLTALGERLRAHGPERAVHLEDVLASGRSPLPDRPDLDAVSAWSTEEHLRYWDEQGLLPEG